MSSPFSFHCMICFEEFHADHRYPVVLPCGHTYVCHVCAERLDKCMECRTPLTIWTCNPPPPPNAKNQQQNQQHYSPGQRYNSSSIHRQRSAAAAAAAQLPKPVAPRKTRLPLPKNVVLLSLMEATELTTEHQKPPSPAHASSQNNNHAAGDVNASPSHRSLTQQLKHGGDSKKTYNQDTTSSGDDDEDDDEESKIKEGTSLALSSCGTYVVTARDGLLIFPTRPSKNASTSLEEDVETLVRFFHLDNSSGENSPAGNHDDDNGGNSQHHSPGQLSYGDRVQIVSNDYGWAKLARGYGFIQAHGIVKVGGSVDRACKLEAMLHSLSVRRKALRRDQSKVDSRFVILMNELQTSLLNDEDLTVICSEAFKNATAKQKDDEDEEEERDSRNEQQVPAASKNKNNINPSKAVQQQKEAPTTTSPTTSLINCDISTPITLARQDTPQALVQTASMVCGLSSLSLPELSPSASRDAGATTAASHTTTSASYSSPQPPRNTTTNNQSVLSAGARAWRERHGRPASKGIDFRTGLSGHTGLLSTRSHPHDYLSNDTRMFLGMSNHTGLNMAKVRRSPSFPPPSSTFEA